MAVLLCMGCVRTNPTGVTTSGLNVRGCGSTECGVLDTLVEGERIAVELEQSGWYRITLGDGRRGWVSASYVRIDGEMDATEFGLAMSCFFVSALTILLLTALFAIVSMANHDLDENVMASVGGAVCAVPLMDTAVNRSPVMALLLAVILVGATALIGDPDSMDERATYSFGGMVGFGLLVILVYLVSPDVSVLLAGSTYLITMPAMLLVSSVFGVQCA